MNNTVIKRIADLYHIFDDLKSQKKLVMAVATDPQALDAVFEAKKRSIVKPILVGKADEIKRIAELYNYDLEGVEIINEPDNNKAIEKSVKLVHDKHADILMKGYISTTELLRGVLDKDWGLRTGRLLSHFALFEVPAYHKLFGMSDVAMNIAPDLSQKIQILQNAVECLNKIGIKNPKVAILGAVEMVHENMQATLDAALMSKMAQRGQIKNCIVDGPLAFDNVVSKESAMHKGIESEVAGDTDLLLLPNIETGNVLYKALVFFAHARLAGLILGAAAPIVLTSRSDSKESKLNSILLASMA